MCGWSAKLDLANDSGRSAKDPVAVKRRRALESDAKPSSHFLLTPALRAAPEHRQVADDLRPSRAF